MCELLDTVNIYWFWHTSYETATHQKQMERQIFTINKWSCSQTRCCPNCCPVHGYELCGCSPVWIRTADYTFLIWRDDDINGFSMIESSLKLQAVLDIMETNLINIYVVWTSVFGQQIWLPTNLKELSNILGNTLIYFLVKGKMKRWMPLLCLCTWVWSRVLESISLA